MKEPPLSALFFTAAFLFFAALSSSAFCACSNDSVSASAVQAYVILDWEDAESLPSERLCVFMELLSNARRLESFSVRSGDYSWNVSSPILLEAGKRQWAGWTHLEPPPAVDGTRPFFKIGNYSVECVDAAGNADEAAFSVNFNSALFDSSAEEARALLSPQRPRIAVYSRSGELLYFDFEKSEWIDDDSIFKSVKDSAFLRRTFSSGRAICFLPKIYKDGEMPYGVD